MSPFKSKAQKRFLYAKKPSIAKRWTKKYGSGSSLPEKLKVSKKKKKTGGTINMYGKKKGAGKGVGVSGGGRRNKNTGGCSSGGPGYGKGGGSGKGRGRK